MTEMEQLAKRVVACKGFRWMPGMLAGTGDHWCRLYEQKPGTLSGVDSNAGSCVEHSVEIGSQWLPDLTDAATLGCLLAMVRDAYKDAYVYAACVGTEDNEWEVFDYCDVSIAGTHRGEARALVAALEAAGGEE